MIKQLLTLLLLLLLCTSGRAQNDAPVKQTGMPHYQGIPTSVPYAPYGADVVWVIDSTQYYFYDYTLEEWRQLGGNGAAGIDGLNFLSGQGPPDNSLGRNGENYLDTDSERRYGPKTGGVWGNGVLLTGPAGPAGPAGAGVVIVGTVANAAALPSPYTGNIGDMFITEDNGGGYVYNDSNTWTYVGPIRGPEGPAGAAGAQGAQGPQGDTGPQGPTGATGPAGANGLDGNDGAPGATGPAGADGNDGATGAQGPQGDVGPAGPTGPQGIQGPAGADGLDGNDGAPGATGPAGADGATGPQGPAGSDGAQGPAGPADWDAITNIPDSVVYTYELTAGIASSNAYAESYADNNDHSQYADVSQYGALGNGADATAAINLAILTGLTIYIPPGEYLITSTLSLVDGQSMIGDGHASVLKTTGDYSILEIGISNTVTGIHFKGDYTMDLTGGVEVPAGQYTDMSIVTKPNQVGIMASKLVRSNYSWNILGCIFSNLTTGVEVYDNGDTATKNKGATIDHCTFDQNNRGLYLGYRTEFTGTSNSVFWGNGWAYFNGGGNNDLIGGSVTRNGIGYYLTDAKNSSGAGSGNPAHGNFSGAKVNHNRRAIEVVDVDVSTIGHRFTNLDIYQTRVVGDPADTLISIVRSSRMFFSNCSMGKGWVKTDATSTDIYFIHCQFMYAVNPDLGNEEVYPIGCYGGGESAWSGEINSYPTASDPDGYYSFKKTTVATNDTLNTQYDWAINPAVSTPTLQEVVDAGASTTTKAIFTGEADFGTTNKITLGNGYIKYDNASGLIQQLFNNGSLTFSTNVSGVQSTNLFMGSGIARFYAPVGIGRSPRAGRALDITGGYLDMNLNEVKSAAEATSGTSLPTLSQVQALIAAGGGGTDQTLSLSGDDLSISDGNTVTFPYLENGDHFDLTSGNLNTTSPIIVTQTQNMIQMYRTGVSTADGFIKLGNITGNAGKMVPLFHFKRNTSQSGFGATIIAESLTDDAVPNLLISGRTAGTVTSNPLLRVSNLSTARFQINANGHTGIMTSAPTAPLDVNGTARIRSIPTGTQSGLLAYDSDGNIIQGSAAGAADNLGNHTLTQALVTGSNRIINGVGNSGELVVGPTSVSIGTSAGFWNLTDEFGMPENTSTPVGSSGQFYWKEFTEDGDDKQRPFFFAAPDRTSGVSAGAGEEHRILTTLDMSVPLTKIKGDSLVHTSGGIDGDFSVSGLPAGRYEVHYHWRIKTNAAGGGINWQVNTTNLVDDESYYTDRQSYETVRDWTESRFMNAAGNALNTYVVVDFVGQMEFDDTGAATISVGPNGIGNMTMGKGSFVRYTKLPE